MLRLQTGEKMDSTYLPSLLNSMFGLPTISVSPAVRVSVLVRQVREHSVKHSGVYRCCRLSETELKETQTDMVASDLHIQIDRSGLVLQSSLSTGYL